MKIQRGIFWRDALKPLCFCLALNPLSLSLEYLLKGKGHYLKKNRQVTHLLCMDDIKLGTTKISKLSQDSQDDFIKMEFGFDECKMNTVIDIK